MPIPQTVPPAPGAEDTEDELITRVRAGDRLAARELYLAHVDRVHRLASRIAGDRALATELTQDVFVQLFRTIHQFRGDSAFTTWLHRVATTTCLNAMRRVRRLRGREADLETAAAEWAPVSRLEPDLRMAVSAAIDDLPPPLRMALVMHAIEGYSHAEVAAAMGVAEGTSKSRVSEARARVRAALAHHIEDRNNG